MLRFRLGRIPVEVHTSHWVLAVLIAYSFLPASASGGAFGAVRPSVVIFGVDGVVGWLLPWPPQPASPGAIASAPMIAAIR